MSFSKHDDKVGDIWHRVDGAYIDNGYETYEGMELFWQTFCVTKVTPCGVWLKPVEQHWKKQRFALSSGCRFASRTKEGALKGLIARKRRHIAIAEHQIEAAKDTLEIALAAQQGGV